MISSVNLFLQVLFANQKFYRKIILFLIYAFLQHLQLYLKYFLSQILNFDSLQLFVVVNQSHLTMFNFSLEINLFNLSLFELDDLSQATPFSYFR